MSSREVARWAAFAAWVCAIPLVLVGSVVTTIGAGMAVQGWWNAEDHFMPLFPIDMWLRDTATFVEHSHRLFGLLVGLFAVIAAGAAWIGRVQSRARLASVLALLAVIGQGVLGGLRVLENSRELAFLHGGVAQAVFALLAVAAILHLPRPGWGAGGTCPAPTAWLWGTALLVYAQIVCGAWYRHGLRGGEYLIAGRFHLHLGLALLASLAIVVVARQLKALSAAWTLEGAPGAAGPRGVARQLHLLLGSQLLLGTLAWLGHRGEAGQGGVTVLETVAAVGHVLVGALLLARLISAALYAKWSSVQPLFVGGLAQGR